ncbi:GNAT family N-acetyltransferase [Rufibacter latericius]|uniref:GNAT family N-acetyltransferase n=1 Tax=Rufibacter latericius TaxID=2487040 RepID=A0A3M9MKS6_9BACT|nr:GNAT family N-acetyltransferase [Rufibacter latericius]RNI25817.1 GNAT family N-acetyltransferase [Rufibacter latericius]
MTFSFAESLTVDQLCTLFNAAFSDYIQPFALSPEVMALKLRRDGTYLALSPLALDQGKPVGFIFQNIGDWHGKKTAYNSGTGVLTEARGQGLTPKMYAFSLPVLKENGVEQCLLEVIQENKRALRIYQELGFTITRTFHVFRHSKADLQWHSHSPGNVSFRQVTAPNWSLYQTFWDVEPSWHQNPAAVDQTLADVQIVEAWLQEQCVGYGIIYPMTGAVSQLAVAPAWRRKGIGQGLLQQMVSLTSSPLIAVVNVDAQAEQMVQFLKARQMPELLGQYEMLMKL